MISFKVPAGEGYIVGDLLHKYAVRGCPSWQVAAYYTGNRPENMGIGEASKGSVLDFVGNVLTCDEPETSAKDGDTKRIEFHWDGGEYTSGPYHLKGLPKQQETLTALLVYSYGQRTSKQNFALVEEHANSDTLTSWYAVPTRHVSTGTFRYRVEVHAEGDEWLVITADSDTVQQAYNAAVQTLLGLKDSIS